MTDDEDFEHWFYLTKVNGISVKVILPYETDMDTATAVMLSDSNAIADLGVTDLVRPFYGRD